jgi:hypothetical protein
MQTMRLDHVKLHGSLLRYSGYIQAVSAVLCYEPFQFPQLTFSFLGQHIS